ncbi:MAG: hypothetical protein ABIO55_09140 [Ginsengibacter sp.]
MPITIKIYFVSFAVTNWLDLFIRNDYKEEILNSIRYCQEKKDMELYGWCPDSYRDDQPCALLCRERAFRNYNVRQLIV